MRLPTYTLALIGGYALLLTLHLVGLLGLPPYDDAWFFQRFALNLLDHGVFAWNIEDGPVHGNTSQLMQGLAVLISAVTREHYVLGVRIALASALIAGLGLGLRLPGAKGAEAVVVLAMAAPMTLVTLASGMETALVLAGMIGFLVLLPREEVPWPATPLVMVALYLLRPDTLLLTGVAWAWQRRVVEQRTPWREGALLAAALVATWGALATYYGTALPLSVTLKTAHTSFYDAHFLEISAVAKQRNLAFSAIMAAPLLYVAAHGLDRRSAGPLLAAGLFVAWHATSTIEVMGMHGRFYAPALPLLLAAAVAGVDGLRRWPLGVHVSVLALYAVFVAQLLARELLPPAGPEVGPSMIAAFAGGACLVMLAPRLPRLAAFGVLGCAALGVAVADRPPYDGRADDRTLQQTQLATHAAWRGLQYLEPCLGPRISVYHSEIGLVGAWLPEAHITDLAGLMSPAVAFRQRSVDAMCVEDQPDVLFLPHRNYAAMNRELKEGACLRGYQRVVGASSAPMHIRGDLAPDFLACRRRLRQLDR